MDLRLLAQSRPFPPQPARLVGSRAFRTEERITHRTVAQSLRPVAEGHVQLNSALASALTRRLTQIRVDLLASADRAPLSAGPLQRAPSGGAGIEDSSAICVSQERLAIPETHTVDDH